MKGFIANIQEAQQPSAKKKDGGPTTNHHLKQPNRDQAHFYDANCDKNDWKDSFQAALNKPQIAFQRTTPEFTAAFTKTSLLRVRDQAHVLIDLQGFSKGGFTFQHSDTNSFQALFKQNKIVNHHPTHNGVTWYSQMHAQELGFRQNSSLKKKGQMGNLGKFDGVSVAHRQAVQWQVYKLFVFKLLTIASKTSQQLGLHRTDQTIATKSFFSYLEGIVIVTEVGAGYF